MEKREVVVITGASAGVGRATARRFAQAGASVALLARGAAGLEGARYEVECLGGRALVVPTDVSDAGEVDAAASRVEAELGPIDVWVNDAMVTIFSRFRDMTADEFRRVTDVTYHGMVHGTQAALKRMLPRDRGTIVQVGSALAYRGIPLQAAYCGAKHAMVGFTESLRTELMHDRSKVWVTMVQLPALNTPQFSWCKTRMPHKAQPVAPIYQPEVAADAIHFAAHRRRREVFVGASTVVAIAGNKILPGVGDWFLGKTGFDAQMYDGPPSDSRRHNLWSAVDDVRDHGAHGDFEFRSRKRSLELTLVKNKGWVALLAGASLATLALMASSRAR